MKRQLWFGLMVWLCCAAMVPAVVCTFDDLALDADSYYGGAGSGSTGFTDEGVYFTHTDSSYAWSGFAYSNVDDTTTAGYTNQFSAITGTDVSGSGNYVVSYVPLDWTGSYEPIAQTISFDDATTVEGAYFSNTTYAYLSMLNGDSFGSAFTADDYFKLIITGYDADGELTGTVEFYLAEGTDIVDEWTWVDLTSLGEVTTLSFTLESSDTGAYGMNTPAYFAMDNLTLVPEPATMLLLGAGVLGLLRKRKS